eukprot:COSAG01_NODE_74_length_28433_cov_41.582269_34_plen_111_part_00
MGHGNDSGGGSSSGGNASDHGLPAHGDDGIPDEDELMMMQLEAEVYTRLSSPVSPALLWAVAFLWAAARCDRMGGCVLRRLRPEAPTDRRHLHPNCRRRHLRCRTTSKRR